MADRQRRKASQAAALILALALAGCGPPVEAKGATAEAIVPDLPAAVEPARARPAVEDELALDREGLLQSPVERVVRRALQRAEKESRGRVRAADCRVAVHVRELGSGAVLAARRADVPQRPASNMKLVTTAAALVLFGPGVDFLTPFEAVGRIEAGTLRGDLVVRASGDPLWDASGDPGARVAAAVDELWAAGLRVVTGALVLDEGTFLVPGPGPGWPPPSQHWDDYCALSGGFSAGGGVFTARVRPGASGTAASVRLLPRPHGLRENVGVTTVERGRVDVRVGANARTVTVRGSLPRSAGEYEARFAQPDPVEVFGAVLAGALVPTAEDPGTRLAELRSPMDALFEPINAESENGVADQLFLALGHTVGGGGTREGGARATRSALQRLDVSAEGLVQVDGSGLSRDNRVTAAQLTGLLQAVLEREDAGARLFRASLASFGRSGTLERRLSGTSADGRAHGKTGWIAGVSSLSGCLETLDGRTLVFAVLIEYPTSFGGANRSIWKPMQDELVTLLVETEA